ncbi:hydrolethalus syndrome protein 1 homolog isoform X1 [Scyliorhinus canicula]|uniref:hydrolethalus syndrome protein 1 homolog isoform X1 n=1 Tax=Scyliorhinus canicula TaxID=7830 RepID=UPI0018F62160|nr:hydrolethalus syndrome protein 1 homolog isoform X1 [Scyliorhinus canicula]XP_038670604.1 hydrolethalus syndrome protein 1 homolog isoform X1 [Scyliorhinus canicula]
MAGLDFTDQDVREQLDVLGYRNVPHHQLREFRKDLEELIIHERSKSQTSSKASDSVESRGSTKAPNCVSQVRNNSIHQPLAPPRIPTWCEFNSGKENQSSNRRGIETLFHHPAEFHQCDAYTKYSIAPKQLGYSSMPTSQNLQNIPNQDSDDSQKQYENSSTSSPEAPSESNRKPILRRKVLRRKNGQLHVCDESMISETDSDAVSELGQRISRFRTLNNEAEFDRESEEVSSTSDAGSITGRRPNSAQPFFTRDLWSSRPGGTDGYGCISNAPKSFIRPLMDHPHTRNIKKSDPVAKYFEYKRNWETFKAPGEKDRKELRWGIREQMFYKNQLPLVSSLFSFHFHCLFPTNVSPIPMNYGGHIYIQYKILNQQDIFIIPCICNIVNKYLLQFTFKVSSLIIGIS